MPFSFFISRRFLISRKESGFLNIISKIAIAGITIGVATLIIALSVLSGFEKTIQQKITDFDSHIKVSSFRGTVKNYEPITSKIEELLGENKLNLVPFASKLAIISANNRQDGINIIGIPAESKIERLQQNIINGEFNIANADSNNIVIGKVLANKLMLKVGDKVTLFALKDDQIPSPQNPPNIERFFITGIFESGMAEYDDLYAYTNLISAQNLFSIGQSINGYDIQLNSIEKIDSLTNLLRKNLTYPFFARSLFESHRNIFTWIELQQKPIPIILGLIIIVAVFNIIGTLLILVLEKTNAIGILKSLGANRKQVLRIFLIQGIFIGFIGIISGNLLAILLIQIQIQFDVITVPASVYFVTKVPFDLSPFIFVLVSVIALVLSLGASIIPSFIAAK
ncbi:MAG TPA: FtsX-like permease family protein, partial [Ignavibacteriaceae bacterium]|nr:FtsX-like permease family protein [Ignavibacteriaceae bacterium]